MKKDIKFYKESSGRWFADLPDYIDSGGTKEDCEMVGGADDWLDIISEGENEISLTLSDHPFEDYEKINIKDVDEDNPEYGATYRVTTYKGIDYSHRTLWLCPVTLFVFGRYPWTIYYKKI